MTGLAELHQEWKAAWEDALAAWSRFTRLTPPRYCTTKDEERKESLTDSFACIRLQDLAVIVSLRQVAELDLGPYARQIQAHEVGHHVYAPANLRDNARLMARIRRGLPSCERHAGLVANLYTDLLINDRLHRSAELDMAAVYLKLRQEKASTLWQLYMRICERLWALPPDTLVGGTPTKSMLGDAELGARLIRAYSRDWLRGASSFAALCFPYVQEDFGDQTALAPFLDTQQAGAGSDLPDGLASYDEDEDGEVLHPSEDPVLTGRRPVGDEDEDEDDTKRGAPRAGLRATRGGNPTGPRATQDYLDLMKSLGVTLSENELVARYYRELAVPHLVPFPSKEARQATDPLPEGLDVWETSSPLSQVDWVETLVRSPLVIPGVTTLERTWGTSEGTSPERVPLDLYLGVDCSGSMPNPARLFSYPVLAGTVLCLSALRARARVQVCLSGHPGNHAATDGFIRDERALMGTLTSYLGTGYAFGIEWLAPHVVDRAPLPRPAHLLVMTDWDIFTMMKSTQNSWELIAEAARVAGGGATFILNMPDAGGAKDDVRRMQESGWTVACVGDMAGLLAFARHFSRLTYGREEPCRR